MTEFEGTQLAEEITSLNDRATSIKLAHADKLEKQAQAIVNRLEAMEKRMKDRLGPILFPQRTIRERLLQCVKMAFGVRIGILGHHAPRPMRLPPAYRKIPALTNAPAITVVTPSFNHGPFLEQTVLSVLNQEYPNLEYIIQDGGSTDETPFILDTYRSRFEHCESQKDGGQTAAVNKGFARGSGDIMAWLNSDDLYLPGALAFVAQWFQAHPDIDVVYGQRILIDEDGHEIGRWVLPGHDNDVMTWADYIPQETLFWRRRIWDRIGAGLDESFRFAMDWDLLLRFREAGAKFARAPRFLGAFRVHWQQKTMAQIAGQGKEEMDRLRRRCLGRDVTRTEIRRAILPYLLKHALCDRLYRLGIVRF